MFLIRDNTFIIVDKHDFSWGRGMLNPGYEAAGGQVRALILSLDHVMKVWHCTRARRHTSFGQLVRLDRKSEI